MSQTASRKRSAPGASNIKISDSAPATSQDPLVPHTTPDQFLQWNQANNASMQQNFSNDPTPLNMTSYPTMASPALRQDQTTQLARRAGHNQVVPRSQYGSNEDAVWGNSIPATANATQNTTQTQQQSSSGTWQQDDEASLDQRAQEVKEAAKGSRKSIPPFVQKLSRFLDESRNTELIRWSPKGDSFVVLDEDEFARTLIPELFKHNNYASFVRQLNMYGFHKRVGLSDNSMRASERKNKSPSEYYNPYFKQGRPNLLWLIKKPKSSGQTKKGRGKQDEIDDDVDDFDGGQIGAENRGPDETLRGVRQPLLISQGTNSLPREELSLLHQELQSIRQQQQIISSAIQKVRRENEHLYAQAAAFQELHSRHENSINAILTFLATIYNRSLESQGNQNIQNLFAAAGSQDVQQQGSVVDMGDYRSPSAETQGSMLRRTPKKPLLLYAPPEGGLAGGVGANPNANISQARPKSSETHGNYQSPRGGTVEEIYDQDLGTPNQSTFSATQEQQARQREGNAFMSFINNTNSRDSESLPSKMDFPQALSHLQNADGKSPLSPAQRNSVLQLMASNNIQPSASKSNNNALTSPDPPNIPLPNLDNWNATDQNLQYLEKTIKEQGDKVDHLSNLLQPLSPSGSIPGLNGQSGYAPQPSDGVDFNELFNSDSYFANVDDPNIDFGTGNDFTNGTGFNFDTPGNDNLAATFNFNEPAGSNGDGRVVETADSSTATTPATIVDDGAKGGLDSPRKKRRRN